MNKYFKLLLIFFGMIGIVVGLYFVSNPNEDDEENIIKGTEYSRLSDTISDRWKKMDKWDEETYIYCMDEIVKSHKKSSIEKKQFNELFDVINSKAIKTIDDYFDAEMKKSGCNHDEIEKNNNGLDYISNYKNPYPIGGEDESSSDNRMKKLQEMYRQYKEVIDFSDKDFKLYARLSINKELLGWTPFDDYRYSWNKKKQELSSGQYYESHFSKIDKVRNAWSSYEEKISQSKDDYYNQLSGLIKNYFDEMYKENKFEKHQSELNHKYTKLDQVNKELQNSYNNVKIKYDNVYTKSQIENRINTLKANIDNKKTEKKRQKLKTEMNDYIYNLKNKKLNNYENLKHEIDELRKGFDDNTKQINQLIKDIEIHQNKMDKYDSTLREVNRKFYNQSSFNTLDEYCSDKDQLITKLINNTPIIKKDSNNSYNSNDSYVNSLDKYSQEINEIIKYIKQL